ncbi:MAG TPA: hypothetical protein VEB59_07745, partial [Gemmatimonadales bacterium]|nr:hypothetical protein [Gemmatimonadales bacterium]
MPVDPADSTADLGKAAPSTDPVVSSADPAEAERDTTLDVRVLGSGFDAGSRAEFLLDGVPVPSMTTNLTTYRSSRELVANVTIAASAVPERYDIQVTTSRDKKAIGTEKLQVLDVLDLGSLGGNSSRAKAINSLGQVTGHATRSDGVSVPFVWADGAMQELPTASGWAYALAKDINDAGIVVGVGNDGSRTLPLRWTPAGGTWTMEVLPTLPGYEGGNGHPLAINDAGDIAGYVSAPGLPGRVALWHAGAVYRVNLAEAGLDPNTIGVKGLTDAGWIVGT